MTGLSFGRAVVLTIMLAATGWGQIWMTSEMTVDQGSGNVYAW